MRAIVPSSFMISQITPAGFSPASRARSTEPSVCPARRSTPPVARAQREDVARAHDVGRASRRRAIAVRIVVRAVGGGDAGGHAARAPRSRP